MGYFPLCLDLIGKTVILVGNGKQIQRKMELLRSFGCDLRQRDTLKDADLDCGPAFVVVGDLPYSQAAEAAGLCAARNIPVNVVDIPELCSFFFPALIREGDLTVSVSTGGRNPGAAAWLREQIQRCIPDNTDLILDWLGQIRQMLRSTYPGRYAPVLRKITEAAFEKNRPLTETELEKIMESTDL